MKIEIKSVIHAGLEAAMFAKRHIHALLFVVLITVICVWGFIFWRYGYQAVFEREEGEVRPLNIKKMSSMPLLEKERARDEFRETVKDKGAQIRS